MYAPATIGWLLQLTYLPLFLCLVVVSSPSTFGYLVRRCERASRHHFIHLDARPRAASSSSIDFQSDSGLYGRGEMHLSAVLEEGDVVVYQDGQWQVDGVTVGNDDEPPIFRYAKVETLQVVWTHNCEHGVIRGTAMTLREEEQANDDSSTRRQLLVVDPTDEGGGLVEFGPEQLVARLPVQWDEATGAETTSCILLAPVSDSLWRAGDG